MIYFLKKSKNSNSKDTYKETNKLIKKYGFFDLWIGLWIFEKSNNSNKILNLE